MSALPPDATLTRRRLGSSEEGPGTAMVLKVGPMDGHVGTHVVGTHLVGTHVVGTEGVEPSLEAV